MVINRFNNLTSKKWLPFQKSWYRFNNLKELLIENILFFTKFDEETISKPNVLIDSDKFLIDKLKSDDRLADRNIFLKTKINNIDEIDFAIFDLLGLYTKENGQSLKLVLNDIEKIQPKLLHRKFVLILLKNQFINGKFKPVAWELAKTLQQFLTLKDEKIGIDQTGELESNSVQINYFKTNNDVIYSLYFRNDEKSILAAEKLEKIFAYSNTNQDRAKVFKGVLPSWQIVKPPPRKKDEILHPAKYPEILIQSFIKHFTDDGDNVFDPMSGTGSTQVAALRLNRNAYGTELSDYFGNIAINRCKKEAEQTNLFEKKNVQFSINIKDVRNISNNDFPPLDYIITSPPYWDMLNMKGAENQAKRKAKGLQLNYSDSSKDFGNITDYDDFINDLAKIYLKLFDLLKPGKFMTVIVKNIKKKGSNYPFAWDLSDKLSEKFILCPESFWFQDDQSIAPYGYGNTWVSNTFHHYCLTFQKPCK